MSSVTSTDDIRHELHLLTSRVEALERTVAKNNAAPSAPFDLVSIESQVRKIAQELFPGPCEFTVQVDPEYPQEKYGACKGRSDWRAQGDRRSRRIVGPADWRTAA